MEYTKRIIANTQIYEVQPYEYEPASYAYLMGLIGIMSALPLPIVNTLASVGYYIAKRKDSYFVRWHSIQALLAQVCIMPFNSALLAWTLRIIFSQKNISYRHHSGFNSLSWPYIIYLTFVVLLNISEFVFIIAAATEVRKGKNVRFFGIAKITDVLCHT